MQLIDDINLLFRYSTKQAIEDHFAWLAKQILLGYQLKLSESLWDITEIEFYLYSEIHPDPFAHKHYNYKTGQFRLHGAGIDIAIGNGKEHGGILLRSLRKAGEKDLVPSPLKVSDAIIANMGTIEKSSATIVPKQAKSSDAIYQTPRIGLQTKNKEITEQQVEFIVSPYRFFTEDQFQAEKYIKALVLGNEGGLDEATYNEYIKSYELGKSISNPLEVATGYFNLQAKAKLMGYYSNKK